VRFSIDAAGTLLAMIVAKLPSPRAAQKYRVENNTICMLPVLVGYISERSAYYHVGISGHDSDVRPDVCPLRHRAHVAVLLLFCVQFTSHACVQHFLCIV